MIYLRLYFEHTCENLCKIFGQRSRCFSLTLDACVHPCGRLFCFENGENISVSKLSGKSGRGLKLLLP